MLTTTTATAFRSIFPATTNGNTNAAAAAAVTVHVQRSKNKQGRKSSLSIVGDVKAVVCDRNGSEAATALLQDGEQPAKVIKVFNNSNSFAPTQISSSSGSSSSLQHQFTQVLTASSSSNNANGLLLSSYLAAASATNRSQPAKLVLNNDIGRLTTNGAEVNLLPSHVSSQMFANDSVASGAAAAAFFHANGKLTLINSGGNINAAAAAVSGGGGGTNGTILLKADQHHSAFSLSNGNVLQLAPVTAASLHFGSLTAPSLVVGSAATATATAASNSENFGHLLAAASAASAANPTATDSKVST